MLMEKQKYIGGVNFEELRAQRVQVYNTVNLDLSTARTDKELVYTGTYIYVLEGTDILANVSIRLNEKFRGLIKLTKGRGVKAPFYRLYITNEAQAGKSVTLAIGVESDTFEVFDVGKALEISGTITETTLDFDHAYIYSYVVAAGGAGIKSHLQLWNPIGSGIDGYIRRIFGHFLAAETVDVRYHVTALTTNVGSAVPKALGGAAFSSCLIKHQANGAYLGVHIFRIMPALAWDMVFDPPFKLPEDKGFQVIGPDNTEVNAGFEWYEA